MVQLSINVALSTLVVTSVLTITYITYSPTNSADVSEKIKLFSGSLNDSDEILPLINVTKCCENS